jgi:hypothetical protein
MHAKDWLEARIGNPFFNGICNSYRKRILSTYDQVNNEAVYDAYPDPAMFMGHIMLRDRDMAKDLFCDMISLVDLTGAPSELVDLVALAANKEATEEELRAAFGGDEGPKLDNELSGKGFRVLARAAFALIEWRLTQQPDWQQHYRLATSVLKYQELDVQEGEEPPSMEELNAQWMTWLRNKVPYEDWLGDLEEQ